LLTLATIRRQTDGTPARCPPAVVRDSSRTVLNAPVTFVCPARYGRSFSTVLMSAGVKYLFRLKTLVVVSPNITVATFVPSALIVNLLTRLCRNVLMYIQFAFSAGTGLVSWIVPE
jgi:hypothetical protein